MAELVNEVKFDFSGAASLAGHLQRAQRYSGMISKDLSDAMKAAQSARNAITQSRMPGGGTHPAGGAGQSAAAQFATFAAAAAGGSAFFYRANNLANPQSMQRFQDALDDTTAVVGHQLNPALREMTKWVRAFGDYLANHPTQTKVLAAGAIGATAIGFAGTAFAVGRSAYTGVKAGVGLVGRAFGYGGGTSGAGGISGAGATASEATRAKQAAAAVQGMRSEAELTEAARSARGRAASGEIGAASEASAIEAELASLKAAQSMPALPAAGRFARLGRIARIGGRFAGPAGIALSGAELGAAKTPESMLDTASDIAMVSPFLPKASNLYRNNVSEENRSWIGRQFTRAYDYNTGINRMLQAKAGFSLNPFDESTQKITEKKSSFGAAYRPATYEDILGSIMNMRQSIIQGGRDPNEETAENVATTAKNTTELVRIAQEGKQPGTDRGTAGR